MNFEIIIFIVSFAWWTVQSPRLLLALVCTRVVLTCKPVKIMTKER